MMITGGSGHRLFGPSKDHGDGVDSQQQHLSGGGEAGGRAGRRVNASGRSLLQQMQWDRTGRRPQEAEGAASSPLPRSRAKPWGCRAGLTLSLAAIVCAGVLFGDLAVSSTTAAFRRKSLQVSGPQTDSAGGRGGGGSGDSRPTVELATKGDVVGAGDGKGAEIEKLNGGEKGSGIGNEIGNEMGIRKEIEIGIGTVTEAQEAPDTAGLPPPNKKIRGGGSSGGGAGGSEAVFKYTETVLGEDVGKGVELDKGVGGGGGDSSHGFPQNTEAGLDERVKVGKNMNAGLGGGDASYRASKDAKAGLEVVEAEEGLKLGKDAAAMKKGVGRAELGESSGGRGGGMEEGGVGSLGYVLEKFPKLEDSTVMFLHVFKCAGSTLRRMLVDWAEAEGQRGSIVVKCDHIEDNGEVCLNHYELLNEKVQRENMARQKVLAGHFLWGFQRHVQTPYLMISALRNPLELFVSAQQYINRKQTKTIETATTYISNVMAKTLRRGGPGAAPGTWAKVPKSQTVSGVPKKVPGQVTGFIRRFVGADRKTLQGARLGEATNTAMANLESLWVVGVVEQMAGFEEVLKRMLDPQNLHAEMWETYATRRYNSSPIKSTDVLAAMDPQLVQHFNGSLALQWSLYEKAVNLWGVRCRGVLPYEMHEDMCTVPPAAVSYD